MSLDTAVTTKVVSEIMSKLGSVIMKGKQIPQLVRIVHEARKFRKTIFDHATSTSATFPELDSPDIEIKNPLDRTTMIKSISFIPDSGFKTNGAIKAFVDDVKTLGSDDDANGDWVDVTDLKLDFEGGKEIKQNRSVKVLIKSGSGTVKMTVFVTFGD